VTPRGRGSGFSSSFSAPFALRRVLAPLVGFAVEVEVDADADADVDADAEAEAEADIVDHAEWTVGERPRSF